MLRYPLKILAIFSPGFQVRIFCSLLLMLLLGLFVISSLLPHPHSLVIHITMWHGLNPQSNRDILEKLVNKFNHSQTGIQVESLYVGQQDQQTAKILTAVVSDAAPDLLWYNPTITGQLVELNAIISLDEKLANSRMENEIVPRLFSSMKYQGKIWSLPFDTNNLGVFYRPSLFKARGINQLPRTWEELHHVAKKLTYDTNGDGKIDRHGIILPLGKGEFTVFSWLPFFWSSGGKLIDGIEQNLAKVILQDNPGAIAALKFWQNLIQDGSAVLSAPERGYEIGDLVTGRVAMEINGPWTLAELNQSGADFAVFPLPAAQQPATVIGGENLFLFKTAPQREQAAFKFAEYTLSPEFQTELALGTGYLPVNLKSRQSPKYQEFLQTQPQIKVFLKQEEYGRTRPIFPRYTRLSDSLGRAIESVLLNKSSPNLALNNAQQRLKISLH